MNKAKRIIALVIALIMILSALAGALSIFVYAANNSDTSAYAIEDDTIIINQKITRTGFPNSEMYSMSRNQIVDVYVTVLTPKQSDPVLVSNGELADADALITGGAFKFTEENLSECTIAYDNTLSNKYDMEAFEIVFRNVRYTGTGDSIEFLFWFDVKDGTEGKQVSYDISHTFGEYYFEQYTPPVNNGSDDDDDEDEDPTWDPITPHIIVDSYNYGGSSVVAGSTLNLSISFKNTSVNYDLDNIVMKITLPDSMTMSSGSNTTYITRLKKNDNFTDSIQLTVKPDALPTSHELGIDFSFQYIANDTRHSGSSSEKISIPVIQLDRFSINGVESPEALYVGEEYPVSVSLINKGQDSVYNVTGILRDSVNGAGSGEFLGNVESGNEESIDFFVRGDVAGMMNAEIEITYEDSNLNVKKLVYPVSIEIMEYEEYYPPYDPFAPGGDDGFVEPTQTDIMQNETAKNALMICGGIIALLTAVNTILKTRAMRREFADEDL